MADRVDNTPRLRPLGSARNILALILREMGTSAGRARGGYLWAVAEPAAGIALLTLLFSLMFRSPPLGTSFPIFYATGILPFMFYNDISGKLGQAIRYSRPLLFYPRLTYADALTARFLLNSLTQVMVFCIVTVGVLTVSDGQYSLHVPSILLGLLMAAALGLGVGTMNCFLFSMFPTWANIWGIITRPMFLVSSVFYTFESVPRDYQDVLWFNPLVHVIGQVRRGFYHTYDGNFVSHGYVYGFSLILLALALILLGRHHRDILDR